MKDDIQRYMERPRRYNNIDGTGEMAYGLMVLGYTLFAPPKNLWVFSL